MGREGVTVRRPLTVRIRAEDMMMFCTVAGDAGIEPSIFARQILELTARYLADGHDYLDALAAIHGAFKPRVRVPAGKAP